MEGNAELREARRQVELMNMARNTLREADREDAAELLQKVIRAVEIRIEGRRDEKARHILGEDPAVGAKAELLLYAARLMREFRRPDRAEAVEKLGRQFAEKAKRAPRARERSRESSPEASVERIEAMQEQIRELARELERLHAEVKRGGR